MRLSPPELCRWCGCPPDIPGPFCDDRCMQAHLDLFDDDEPYLGALVIRTACDHPGCWRDTDTLALRGPVYAPGAWIDAHVQVEEVLHGHPVHVSADPAVYAPGDEPLLDMATIRISRRGPHAVD